MINAMTHSHPPFILHTPRAVWAQMFASIPCSIFYFVLPWVVLGCLVWIREAMICKGDVRECRNIYAAWQHAYSSAACLTGNWNKKSSRRNRWGWTVNHPLSMGIGLGSRINDQGIPKVYEQSMVGWLRRGLPTAKHLVPTMLRM